MTMNSSLVVTLFLYWHTVQETIYQGKPSRPTNLSKVGGDISWASQDLNQIAGRGEGGGWN